MQEYGCSFRDTDAASAFLVVECEYYVSGLCKKAFGLDEPNNKIELVPPSMAFPANESALIYTTCIV